MMNKIHVWFATATLIAFAMLVLIVSNVHQPTMDYGLHCSVHDYIAATLGGECDKDTSGLFTDMNSMVVAAMTLCATFFVLAVALVFFKTSQHFFSRSFLFASPPYQLSEFYSRGLAQSRRFV